MTMTEINGAAPNIGSSALMLEPLSKATETAFRKPNLQERDYLMLHYDDKDRRFTAEVKSLTKDENGEWKEDSWEYPSHEARQFFRRIPEKYLAGGSGRKYKLGATDFTALLIMNAWPKDRIVFRPRLDLPDSKETELILDYLYHRFMAQSSRASIAAQFKIGKVLPPLPADWIEHPDENLRLADYQKAAVLHGLGHEEQGLFMDRGTGKTAVVIKRICLEANRKWNKDKKMSRWLIVAPPQVRINWKEEIKRFTVLDGKTIIVKGSQFERIKCIMQGVASEEGAKFSAVIVGYDSFVASKEAFLQVPWDGVVLDESHYIKSNSTKRWKAMLEARNWIEQFACIKLIMTGTPIGNSLMDLWTQLEFLGEGLSGFQSFKSFRQFHGVWEDTMGQHTGVSKLVAVKNVPLIRERLSRLTFSITKEEAGLNLPDKVYDVWEVEMTEPQKKIYDQVCETLIAELEDKLSGQTNQLTVEHILTKLLRLAQITSGHVVWDAVYRKEDGELLRPKRVDIIPGGNPKVDAVIEMMTAEENDPKGKTLIWCSFVKDIKTLDAALKLKGFNGGTYYGATPQDRRDEYVKSFNGDPEFTYLVLNPQTAGEGLNLVGYNRDDDDSDTYCDHVIFFSQNWSSILRGQAEDRAHRRGTRMPVRITDLVVPDTIDEEIRARVKGKQDMALDALAVKDILKRIVGR